MAVITVNDSEQDGQLSYTYTHYVSIVGILIWYIKLVWTRELSYSGTLSIHITCSPRLASKQGFRLCLNDYINTTQYLYMYKPWWRHWIETLSALLAICVGISPVTGEFPAQRPVTRSFDVFFDVRLNKRLSKQLRGWWFETP